jgi:hypothetical protein
MTTAATAGTSDFRFGLGAAGSPTGDVTLVAPMIANITGETDQTTIRPYVSVGVESAPAYHGSMVDGVKCFDTDRLGNPIATSATYEAVTLNGVVGTYVSTPDSVAASITGDIDIRVKFQPVVFPPAPSAAMLASKLNTWSQYSYDLILDTAGRLVSRFSSDGTVLTTATSSTAAAGTAIGYRVTRVAATGVVTFYTTTDYITWTQLGAPQATTAGAIKDGSDPLALGVQGTSGFLPTLGKIYQAQIYNGINGTLAVDFNASRYAGGTTLTGSTGETWTLQGNAVIHPTNYPIVGYVPWEARTNLCLQSEDFSTTWTNNNTTESVNAVVAPNGTTTADKLVEAATSTTHTIYNTLAGTSGVYTSSAYLKAAERTWVYLTEGNSVTATAYFDLINGVVGTVSGTGSPSARIVDAGNGWYRCSMTFTAGANANIQIGTSTADLITSFLGDIAKGVYVWGAMLELGAFATPYIPTTTVAVARNADLLTYTGAEIANIKSLACTFSRGVGVSNVGVTLALTDGTGNEFVQIQQQIATSVRFVGGDGGVTQWDVTASNAYSPGSVSKASQSFATNDIKMDKDGTAQTADTIATIPTVSQICVGHFNGSFQSNGPVNHIYGWTRNLSQSELGAIDRA